MAVLANNRRPGASGRRLWEETPKPGDDPAEASVPAESRVKDPIEEAGNLLGLSVWLGAGSWKIGDRRSETGAGRSKEGASHRFPFRNPLASFTRTDQKLLS
ncbi:MAG: hypothetical protein U1E05_15890, partial [Patescibacteria group bacterium]|nr:hypothetical protein [Patescibacteria group bacterium]